MTDTELAFLPALDQARLVRQREISPVELVETYLQRIDKLDPQLNAYVTVAADQALEQARRAADRAGSDDAPAFLGVPIPIKDLTDTAGIRTTFSSRHFAERVPSEDAAVVKRLKKAGFIVLGKTNTPEFGTIPFTVSELNGDAHNPWDLDRTTGGSSGGAGAALAAGLCPVAHGTDGGGSVRIPSSCCGVFGLKPARGRISRAPNLGESWEGCTTDGVLARTVADAAALLDVMAGYETGDPYWAPPPERPFFEEAGAPPGRLRVAVTTTTPNYAPVDPAVQGAVDEAASLLGSLGHEVEPATPDWIDDAVTDAFIKIVQTNPVYYGATDPSLLDPINQNLFEVAKQLDSMTYVQAAIALQQLSRKVVAFWDDYDVLLTATLAIPPPPVRWIYEEEDVWMQLARAGLFLPFCPPANITGLPAVSVPLHWTDDGVPIGVQLVGRPAGEAALLRLSSQLEAERPWADRRPPVS